MTGVVGEDAVGDVEGNVVGDVVGDGVGVVTTPEMQLSTLRVRCMQQLINIEASLTIARIHNTFTSANRDRLRCFYMIIIIYLIQLHHTLSYAIYNTDFSVFQFSLAMILHNTPCVLMTNTHESTSNLLHISQETIEKKGLTRARQCVAWSCFQFVVLMGAVFAMSYS